MPEDVAALPRIPSWRRGLAF